MRVLIVRPGKRPQEAEIDGSLESMQEIVGGKIQAIYPFNDTAAVICCEESGSDMRKNRAIYTEDGSTVLSIVSGTFFICDAPIWSEYFSSLSAEQLKRYSALFAVTEIFISSKSFITIIPCN